MNNQKVYEIQVPHFFCSTLARVLQSMYKKGKFTIYPTKNLTKLFLIIVRFVKYEDQKPVIKLKFEFSFLLSKFLILINF